jgi:hypothetical protein
MEAVRDFLPFQDTDQAAGQVQQPGVVAAVEDALAALQGAGSTAVADAAFWRFRTASGFAGRVEELSRAVEYFQLVAADAVDRSRRQAISEAGRGAGAAGWTTGWRDSFGSGADADTAGASTAAAGTIEKARPADGEVWASAVPGDADMQDHAGDAGGTVAGGDAEVVADGYRNTTEFLRARLRIGAGEARRRLALAEDVLPRTGLGGRQLQPPVREELGAAVASAEVASRAASIITVALDRVRHVCDAETAARMEHALTRTAAENDPDFLVRVARSWTDAIDQDGAEPSEELLRQLQGAFIRKPRHGLHHLEIFATADQFEYLLTVMNTATNPRTTVPDGSASTPDTAEPGAAGPGSDASAAETWAAGSNAANGVSAQADGPPALVGGWAASGTPASGFPESDPPAVLDLRTRAQKMLDGLVGGCKVALAAGALPATGGLRPQVMVTIDYQDLLSRLGDTPNEPDDKAGIGAAEIGAAGIVTAGRSGAVGRPAERTGTLLFTGPVTASTARKIACDADIIPVLLGGEGRILDIGRSSRIFPPHIRKALTARDQGCSFPGCTMPAPWCEAHHITYWSRGGTTGTDNGTLLCSHHHHLIHKEQWTIQLRTGIPWFIPPPHLDPRQRPRRNTYFHPASHPQRT